MLASSSPNRLQKCNYARDLSRNRNPPFRQPGCRQRQVAVGPIALRPGIAAGLPFRGCEAAGLGKHATANLQDGNPSRCRTTRTCQPNRRSGQKARNPIRMKRMSDCRPVKFAALINLTRFRRHGRRARWEQFERTDCASDDRPFQRQFENTPGRKQKMTVRPSLRPLQIFTTLR